MKPFRFMMAPLALFLGLVPGTIFGQSTPFVWLLNYRYELDNYINHPGVGWVPTSTKIIEIGESWGKETYRTYPDGMSISNTLEIIYFYHRLGRSFELELTNITQRVWTEAATNVVYDTPVIGAAAFPVEIPLLFIGVESGALIIGEWPEDPWARVYSQELSQTWRVENAGPESVPWEYYTRFIKSSGSVSAYSYKIPQNTIIDLTFDRVTAGSIFPKQTWCSLGEEMLQRSGPDRFVRNVGATRHLAMNFADLVRPILPRWDEAQDKLQNIIVAPQVFVP